MTVEIGSPAPAFELVAQDRERVSLDSLKGKNALIVFIPFPFTGICDGEACMLRDSLAELNQLDANVLAITTHAVPTNKKWSDENGIVYPVLSDFWPHGAVAHAFGAFNDSLGVANRYSYVLDAEGIVRDIINTDTLGVAREHDAYVDALGRLSEL
jgi:peroxiredoxin (alkyl hydroperoxide reductase subunit C)